MARARIFKPAKNAMQSGARARKWVLAYEPETRRAPDPLMGWTSADDTLNEVRLHFETMEEAVDFADQERSRIFGDPAAAQHREGEKLCGQFPL